MKRVPSNSHKSFNESFWFVIVNQLWTRWWHPSGREWWAETNHFSRCWNRIQRPIYIRCWWCTLHRWLGCRWERIRRYWWPLAKGSLKIWLSMNFLWTILYILDTEIINSDVKNRMSPKTITKSRTENKFIWNGWLMPLFRFQIGILLFGNILREMLSMVSYFTPIPVIWNSWYSRSHSINSSFESDSNFQIIKQHLTR